jgi:hypothetical protein
MRSLRLLGHRDRTVIVLGTRSGHASRLATCCAYCHGYLGPRRDYSPSRRSPPLLAVPFHFSYAQRQCLCFIGTSGASQLLGEQVECRYEVGISFDGHPQALLGFAILPQHQQGSGQLQVRPGPPWSKLQSELKLGARGFRLPCLQQHDTYVMSNIRIVSVIPIEAGSL